mgnify:CR=1 FL=1
MPHHPYTILVDGDYYKIKTAEGKLRIGQKDVGAITFPPSHPLYESANEARTESAVEDLFDLCVEQGVLRIF